jgi:hypothetical protein
MKLRTLLVPLSLTTLTPALPTKTLVLDHPTHYPTTITHTLPTTTTFYVGPNPAFPVFTGRIAYITTMTVTVLEPWTASPTSFPTTVTRTLVSDMVVTTTLPSQPPTSYVHSYRFTNTDVWVVGEEGSGKR